MDILWLFLPVTGITLGLVGIAFLFLFGRKRQSD